MKYIIEIDGVKSTRYKYNVWTVFEYEDRTVGQNARIFCSDDLGEFLEFIKSVKGD